MDQKLCGRLPNNQISLARIRFSREREEIRMQLNTGPFHFLTRLGLRIHDSKTARRQIRQATPRRTIRIQQRAQYLPAIIHPAQTARLLRQNRPARTSLLSRLETAFGEERAMSLNGQPRPPDHFRTKSKPSPRSSHCNSRFLKGAGFYTTWLHGDISSGKVHTSIR